MDVTTTCFDHVINFETECRSFEIFEKCLLRFGTLLLALASTCWDRDLGLGTQSPRAVGRPRDLGRGDLLSAGPALPGAGGSGLEEVRPDLGPGVCQRPSDSECLDLGPSSRLVVRVTSWIFVLGTLGRKSIRTHAPRRSAQHVRSA